MDQEIIEKVAAYFRQCARAGKNVGCNNTLIARLLRITPVQVRHARRALVKQKRLVSSNQRYLSIDGEQFSVPKGQGVEAESLMTTLRRHFRPVYDARVEERPNAVAEGKPKTVMVGSVKMDVGHAFALATMLGPQSRMCVA